MKRKRSVAVTLVLSGSLLAGCSDSSSSGWDDSNSRTNNTYVPQYGYWHSYYGHWYPYPHNFYDPMRGYYYGGRWSTSPDSNPTTPRISSSSGSHSGSSSFGSHSSGSVSRGGFGSSGHSSS